MRSTATFIALGFALLALPNARAQDGSSLGAVEAYATLESAGVRAAISGDADGDARVDLAWRVPGEAGWRDAHPLARIDAARFAGVLLDLVPGTAYEARVTLADPDNPAPASKEVAFITRPGTPAMPSSPTHLYVDPGSGSDLADGSPGTPLRTLQAAVDRAGPGFVLHARPGIYREAVTVMTSGEPGNPLVLQGEPGAVLDGSRPDLAAGEVAWTPLGDGVYSTPHAGPTWYAALGETRLYDYHALQDLLDENGGQAGMNGVLSGGFFWDETAGVLYVRLPDRSDPTGQPLHAAVLPGGVLIDTQHDVVVAGLEVRFYGDGEYSGFGVDVRASDRVTVQGCSFHNLNTGVRIRRGGAEGLVQDNRVRDTSVWGWPWDSVKAHYAEASAVEVNGGRGNVVRRNDLRGTFNGIYVGEFSDAPDEGLAADTEVIDNRLAQHGDDGLEPEGACLNVRFVGNAIVEVKNAVSLSPIQLGPTWLVRTLIAGYRDHALKLNNGSSGPIFVYHTTAWPAADAAEAQAWAPAEPFGPLASRNNIWAGHFYAIENGLYALLAPVDMDFDDLFTDRADGGPLIKWMNVRYDTLAQFSDATGLEQNGFSVAPAFEDPGAGDYRLASGHALLDAGLVIPGINDAAGRVPDGRPDVGAVERIEGAIEDGSDGGDEADGADAGDASDASDGADASDGSDGSDAGGGDEGDDATGGGCGCGSSSTTAGLGLAVLGLLPWRRR